MPKPALPFCVSAAILLWLVPALRAQNLISNPGFETGTFSGWTTNTGNSSGQIVAAAAHSGSYGAEFSETILMGDIGSEDQISQTVSTHAGTNYFVSFWANGVRQSSLGANWNGVNLLTNSIYYIGFSPLTSGWSNYQFVVKATASTTPLLFSFKASPGGNGSTSLTYLDDVEVLPLPNYNVLSIVQLPPSQVKFSYLGIPLAKYALDRTFNLLPPIQWTPQSTNATDGSGNLVLMNAPVATTNNFWRLRLVQ
jgi:hypothetical protein